MKKLLLILLLVCNTAFSQTVMIPFSPGSVTDIVCRKIFEIFDKNNKTNTVFQNVAGGDLMVGHKQFLTLNNALFCSGNSVAGINQFLNPAVSPPAETLVPILPVFSFTHFIYSPSRNKSFKDILKKDKLLLVGAPTNNSAKILAYVLRKNNVNYEIVVFKKPFDAIVSLKEGSLDLYIDGGSIKNMVEGMPEIKEVAYISKDNKSISENLATTYPILNDIASKIIIYANKDITNEQAQLLNKQLNSIISSHEFQVFYKERIYFHTLINGSLLDAENLIKREQRIIKDVYN